MRTNSSIFEMTGERCSLNSAFYLGQFEGAPLEEDYELAG